MHQKAAPLSESVYQCCYLVDLRESSVGNEKDMAELGRAGAASSVLLFPVIRIQIDKSIMGPDRVPHS
jgi:hypothetical protein